MGLSPQDRSAALVWDLPARVCHWGFALSLAAAWWIAFRHDPESETFKYHLPLGCLAAWFAAVRLGLGLVGSPLSRWRRWFHPPRVIVGYFRAVAAGRAEDPPGVNPGTLLYAPLLWISVGLLVVTGWTADWVETWHGWIAWLAVGLITVHLLGLALHAWRHRGLTPLAMVHGRRAAPAEGDLAPSARVGPGVVLVLVSAALAITVWLGFDPVTCVWRVLPGLEISFPLIQKG
jgi:cytochrome b